LAFAYADYQDIRAQSRTLTDVTASSLTLFVMRVGETSSEIPGEVVSGSFFPMLHVTTAFGRVLGPAYAAAESRRWRGLSSLIRQ
jgi:hypothetical protein